MYCTVFTVQRPALYLHWSDCFSVGKLATGSVQRAADCTRCTVLYCTVLYCTVLYCTVLYCTVLYCTVLYCTVLYCTVLYCTVVLYCNVLYCIGLHSVLYFIVLCCIALAYSVCNKLHDGAMLVHVRSLVQLEDEMSDQEDGLEASERLHHPQPAQALVVDLHLWIQTIQCGNQDGK